MLATAAPTSRVCRRTLFLAVGACAALHASGGNAGMLYSVQFNDITSASISTTQYQTGNWLVFNATFANADRSGFNAIHALQRSGTVQGGAGDYAVMIFGNNVVTQKTGFAGANSTGVTYYASYDIGPTVYTDPNQATQAGDTFLVEILRADNTPLTSNAVTPGAWAGTQTFSQSYFSYVGDGSGPLRLQLSSGNTQTRFVGAIDNMAFWDTVPVPEPSTCAMALASVACGSYGLWRRVRRLAATLPAGRPNTRAAGFL